MSAMTWKLPVPHAPEMPGWSTPSPFPEKTRF
jgi:hypothetical protein